jgi:hypothetical protein
MASTNLSSRETLRQAGAGREPHDAAKWPARKTVLFVGGASLALWLVILFIATQLFG